MKHEDKLGQLVENALDFLNRSLSELEQSPKYSVIHFYAAVELLLKARLLAEHWSLVIAKRQEADLKRFLSGDFQSVTLDEAAERLDKIVQSPLTKAELDQFRSLARHRNRMVHFFHEVATKKAETRLKQTIALEQLTAWYFLNRLLRDRWGNVFKKWKDDLAKVAKELNKYREYLQVVYQQVLPELAVKAAKGSVIERCLSCQFDASEVTSKTGLVRSCECCVCQLTSTYVTTTCPLCSEPISFVGEGFAHCPSCGNGLEPKDLVVLLDEDEHGTKDYFQSGMPAHCAECEGYETVVHHGGKCVCASCLAVYDDADMHPCDYCGSVNAGNMEDSYSIGCVACDGRTGNMKDD